MKKIGIDARLYSKTGVGVYIRNLLHHLSRQNLSGFQYYVYCLKSDLSAIQLPKDKFIIRPVPYLWHTFGEQLGFCRALMADNLDLMHFTYFSYPILYTRKFISTIHDMILLQHKTGKASMHSNAYYELKHMVFRHVFATQVKRSLGIITPTNTVKDQIISTFGDQYKNKINTIYEGLDYKLTEAKPNQKLRALYKKPFFMYVGNFYPHKNIEQLVRAFESIDNQYDLILIGPDDYFSHHTARIVKQLSLSDRVHMVHNVSEEDLVFYYKNAEALVHPSLSEGFGLPLVEAAYFDLPVIASNIPVFRELLGNQYLRFDPHDSASITKTMNQHLHKPLHPSYDEILKKCSFDKMTKDISKLYGSYSA
ncbi:MAG: hypothetical protein RI947_365 [Candidatus Parcubacteria bacterium]|jgi:glycosyltransferase involved in cell wall biosynthesis